jgi:D-alanyl-D-alanine carboxypeptidase/D-alanyl-D-alanine-endopeptidase (penicillin-binding protein 4)
VARVESAPLAEVVAEMLTTSDDNTAEMLLKEIGLRAEGEGTREAGARAVLKALLSWDVDITGAVVTDGSGLGRGNRVSCELLVEVLDHVGWASPVGQGLPIAERTGTLAGLDLFTGTGVEGVLRGKTGTLTGARALAGYYPDPAGAVYTFALVVNTAPGIDATEVAAPLWTALGRALAAAPDAPPAASPAPAPPVPVGAG